MTVDEQSFVTKKSQSLQCPVCGDQMAFQITKGRKSGKPSLMVKCFRDGRHFRGFICDRDYLQRLLEHLEQGQKLVSAPKQVHRTGRPRVTARRGFNDRFGAVLERLGRGEISRRKASLELGIGYATLKRLIDGNNKAE